MRIFFVLFFIYFYSFVVSAQNLIQDTLLITFNDFSSSNVPLIFAEVEDSREQGKNGLGIYERNKYWIIPVDLLIQSEESLSQEIQAMFPPRDATDSVQYKLEIKKFRLNKNTNSFVYPHYVLNAIFNIYHSKISDSSKYLGSLLYENTIGENFFSEDLKEGFESVLHSWQSDFGNDMKIISEGNHLFQNLILENFRIEADEVKWINLYGGIDYIYGLKDYLIDGEIYFSNREARKWFYRNGYGIRYRNSDTFESIEFGLSVDYLQYRINPRLIFKFKSQLFIGANNWKDYKTYDHEFYDAFIGDISFGQSLIYNPLDKTAFIFGIGIAEDITYIYSKDFRINVGLLFHLGIKL